MSTFNKLSVNSLAAAVACSGYLLPMMVSHSYSEEASDERVIEEVVVTGSRIKRDPNLSSGSPVQSVSAKDLQQSGEFSITDAINDIPALLSSVSQEASINTANSVTFGEGANILSLRGLGSERTLVLVNGVRHVGGVRGSSAVDIGSIPTKLIESVEVVTGGASAVYGSDAVSGVVNFVLRDNFSGFELDTQAGMSSHGDGEQLAVSALYGVNFADDKGNIALALDYRSDQGLRVSDSDNGLAFGSGANWTNPDLRFQQGDISVENTPNFAEYYNYSNTELFRYGLEIPQNPGDFVNVYAEQFGSRPDLSPGELALIQRAANAPSRTVLPFRTFPFTSGYGYIIPGNPYTFEGFDAETAIDLDGNGRPDCLDSFTGYNSTQALGGCWNVGADGSYRPIKDGLVSGSFEGFGGDSFNTIQQQNGYILLPAESTSFNLLGHFDFNEAARLKGELKYVQQETENEAQPTSFWDLLYGAPDNPYLPEFIQGVAQETGGVAITMDPIGIGTGIVTTERDTLRGVLGLTGDLGESWHYDVTATHGRFNYKRSGKDNGVIVDRFLSAIDAVSNPETGAPDCRVNLDANAPQVATPFNIPVYDPGYFSFTPGDGSCVPLNIWAGRSGISQEAVDWVTTASSTELRLRQTALNAFLAGDSEKWFSLPAGALSFVFGAEYREEKSEAIFDPWTRGVIPQGAPFEAGTLVESVSNNASLVFRPALKTENENGSFDVFEFYSEVSIPILASESGQKLNLELAARFSDYSTVGNTSAYKTNLIYTPLEGLNFRLSQSRAVRAPNITELFGPAEGATFRPTDVCDTRQNPDAQTQANCITYFQNIGIDPFDAEGNYVYEDPLSASFGGVTSGNENLKEETADSFTLGLVWDELIIDGFSLTLDYWSIEIDDAIRSVTADDIVRGCFLGPSLNENFCQLLGRNNDVDSAQAGGLNFIRTTEINFAKLETQGVDFSMTYRFDIRGHELGATLSGTKVNKLDFFIDPSDLTVVDQELEEVNRPKWAGNLNLSWQYQKLNLAWQTQYIGDQLYGGVEIEEFEEGGYSEGVMRDATYIHDISASFDYSDNVSLYGGIKNITEELPFITNFAYPASPRGRFFFIGLNYTL